MRGEWPRSPITTTVTLGFFALILAVWKKKPTIWLNVLTKSSLEKTFRKDITTSQMLSNHLLFHVPSSTPSVTETVECISLDILTKPKLILASNNLILAPLKNNEAKYWNAHEIFVNYWRGNLVNQIQSTISMLSYWKKYDIMQCLVSSHTF